MVEIAEYDTIDEFLEMVEELKEDAANGMAWFNGYMSIDDFLFKELGANFPDDSEDPVENTIEAIKLYAERARDNKDGKLNDEELKNLHKVGIKYVSYTDAGVTNDTVTKLVDSTEGRFAKLRLNYLDSNNIEIVSIDRVRVV